MKLIVAIGSMGLGFIAGVYCLSNALGTLLGFAKGGKPLWPIALWLLALLAIGFAEIYVFQVILNYEERRKHAPGCCRNCGCDLTGNESRVCPECGTAVHGVR